MSSQPQPAPGVTPEATGTNPAIPAWRARLRRHLNWKLAGALALLAAVLYVAWRTAFPAPQATLMVRGSHNFRAATLSIWIDGTLVQKSDVSGSLRKKFGILESVQGSFAQPVSFPAGSHTVKVEIAAPDEGYDESKEIQGQFAENRERTLSVTAEKRGGLYLAWRDNGAGEPVPEQSSGSGMGKLFASLLLTISGSIVSAIIGFLVQERMKALRDKSNAS